MRETSYHTICMNHTVWYQLALYEGAVEKLPQDCFQIEPTVRTTESKDPWYNL